MSSPSQRRGGCGHMMAGFDLHSVCALCRDKKKGSDPCIETPPASCSHCDALTSEQKAQLSTPSYKLKKGKKEAKSSTPAKASDTQSHPRGPGTCVGSGGRGRPDNLWFEWASREKF